MNKKCIGCGAILQDIDSTKEGYTTSLDKDYCMRCFRIKNYGDYKEVNNDNSIYIDILKQIPKKDLVLHVVDLLNIEKDLNSIRNYLTNNMILVLNKRDALPRSLNDNKIMSYFKNLYPNYLDIVVISSTKNYNIDLLVDRIYKYKTSNNVHIVGSTNTGKSSLINSLLKYSNQDTNLTISPIPSTTLNLISIRLANDLTIIDTPGLIDNGNITNYLDKKLLKKLVNKKEIKPKTYQIKDNEALIIEDICRIDYHGELNSLTLYLPNSISVKKINGTKHEYMLDKDNKKFNINSYNDLVIPGLGFIKIVNKCNLDININKNVDVYTRNNFI